MAGICVSLTTHSCVASFSNKTFLIVYVGQSNTEMSNGHSNYEGFEIYTQLAMLDTHQCAYICVCVCMCVCMNTPPWMNV